jgi:3-oxoacyl-[acyl-carrier-protein] synthase-3
VPHQANERILRAASNRIGIPIGENCRGIAKYGNSSAASISMAFGWAVKEGIFCVGDKTIFCRVGAGLPFSAGLLVL